MFSTTNRGTQGPVLGDNSYSNNSVSVGNITTNVRAEITGTTDTGMGLSAYSYADGSITLADFFSNQGSGNLNAGNLVSNVSTAGGVSDFDRNGVVDAYFANIGSVLLSHRGGTVETGSTFHARTGKRAG